ncbi:MAG: capsule biosynthesis protein [Sediminimonas sp.]|uniref:capsule biosynthesis protein n=1 Tax=Sediminimonas sp. TaxID=2823379 RepID=UPI00286FEBDB|nr:capsule biosynthesis protein [Sediminimonas sp.]MDR9485849.1 capsule biosynthesis protein [Sediminimonas sp.]
MTTKPKARKFRIRRNGQGAPAAAAPDTQAPSQSAETAQANAPQRPASVTPRHPQAPQQPQRPTERPQTAQAPQGAEAQGQVSSPAQVSAEQQIDEIRREGLTGRQLRMARRVAQKHGLAPTSDFDAVRLLRAQGVDPFQRSTMLELVVPQNGNGDGGAGVPATTPDGHANLPQTVQARGNTLPSTEMAPADRRAQEVMEIQRDIARRRRRKMLLLLTRLAAFVFLPTFLAGWYFFNIATPMYSTKSEFLILQADSQGGSGLGGLLSGTQFATNQDSIAVQSYLQSQDAMQRLERDIGFASHFSQDHIDPIQRLDNDASSDDAYGVFKKNVKIGYDPTEGVIRMEVIAADPKTSVQFSEHLIAYAEERVDQLSRRKREDQMREASKNLEQAKAERRAAQQKLVELQEGTLLDPEGEIANIRSLIGSVEMQLQEKELALATQMNNVRPNQARVDALRTEIRLLKQDLDKQNARLNEASTGDSSLAAKTARIQMAKADLATADLFLQSALQNEKQTELEASRQVRYLTTSVKPVEPDDPAYPRAFENTILALLIFSGIYLMVSLTASILREQVSS